MWSRVTRHANMLLPSRDGPICEELPVEKSSSNSQQLQKLQRLNTMMKIAIGKKKKDFPGSPVVKTPCFQYRGAGFDP